ncbi:MAG: M13 family metallopeptidase [Pseudomonadota bacterium]|nr:M13 family metallopeptidase [Pseudomonadota bacterium]
MTLRPLACALALGLLAGLAASPADAQKKRRSAATPEPVSAECTDFYSHANATWLLANPLPAGKGSVSALGQLAERARAQQIQVLDASMQAPQTPVQTLLGDFWASGLDEAGVESDGAKPLVPLLQRIDAIKRNTHVAPAFAALHQVGIPVGFHFGADVDLKNPDRHIGYLSQGGLGLPDPAYYTRKDPETEALMRQYEGYVQQILALTGVPQKQLAAQAKQVLDLETRLAQASRPLSLLRDAASNYAPVQVNALDAQYRNLQISQFLSAQGVTDDTISVAHPALLAELDTLIKGLKPEQWRAYLRWRVGDSMAPYLASAWRDAHFDFRGRVLAGKTAPPPRRQQVLEAINDAAGPMLGREYVDKYAPAATRERAQHVAQQVRDALEQALQRDGRLGAQARAEAQAKLAALKIEIGSPARDLDFTVQPMGRGSFGGNMLIASTWQHREEMKRIGHENADRRWDVLPQQPALIYDPGQNRLIVTAAMLQAPVLDTSQPEAAHYGALGALIGHELSHGFDNHGRTVDAKREVRDWWTPVDSVGWESLGRRIAGQYGVYPYPAAPDVYVNGALTSDENLADLSGMELAWAAYRQAAPGTDQEAQKAFYQAWAAVWPEHMSAEFSALHAARSAHAHGKWRTNGPLVNVAGFGEVYGCKPGTPMQAEPANRIVLWPEPAAE